MNRYSGIMINVTSRKDHMADVGIKEVKLDNKPSHQYIAFNCGTYIQPSGSWATSTAS